MPLIYVDTLEDPRLDAFARLTEAQLRSKLEPERALFIAESQKVIERAFEGGMEPISLLMEEKWLPSMAPLIERMEERADGRAGAPEMPVFVAPHDELERLTGFELTRGALGAFRRPALPTVADVLHEARLVAVLEDITNHTNVGAIFRSAAALGVDAVLVSPACYDPLYRRAVRVSMGTVFQVPWTYIPKGRRTESPRLRDLERRGHRRTARARLHLRRHGTLRRLDDPRRAERAFGRARGRQRHPGEACAAVRHRRRGALPRHHRPLRPHRAHPHGPRRRFLERRRLQRRGLLRLPAAEPAGEVGHNEILQSPFYGPPPR